jgi:hypothetical protein
MPVSGSHEQIARKPIPSLIGWAFAAIIVVVATFGRLTGQSIPTLVELRHDMDGEFARSSIGRDPSSTESRALVQIDYLRPADRVSRFPREGFR